MITVFLGSGVAGGLRSSAGCSPHSFEVLCVGVFGRSDEELEPGGGGGACGGDPKDSGGSSMRAS